MPVQVPVRATDKLMDLIRKEVHPSYWDRKGVAIEGRNGNPIVRASKAVHDATDRFLSTRRATRSP